MTKTQHQHIEHMSIQCQPFKRYIFDAVYPSRQAHVLKLEGEFFAFSGDGLLDCIFQILPDRYALYPDKLNGDFGRFLMKQDQREFSPDELSAKLDEFINQENEKFDAKWGRFK